MKSLTAKQRAQARANNVLLNPDTYLLLGGLAGLGALALSQALVAYACLLAVAILTGLRARSWQVLVLLLALCGSVAWLSQRSVWLYHVAEVNAITATTKAPGLALPLPGSLFSEGAIVAGGRVYSFSDTLRRGEVLAIGDTAIGSVAPDSLQRGELGIEPAVGQTRISLPKKGIYR